MNCRDRCSLWRLSIEGVVVDITLLFVDEKCRIELTSDLSSLTLLLRSWRVFNLILCWLKTLLSSGPSDRKTLSAKACLPCLNFFPYSFSPLKSDLFGLCYDPASFRTAARLTNAVITPAVLLICRAASASKPRPRETVPCSKIKHILGIRVIVTINLSSSKPGITMLLLLLLCNALVQVVCLDSFVVPLLNYQWPFAFTSSCLLS